MVIKFTRYPCDHMSNISHELQLIILILIKIFIITYFWGVRFYYAKYV